MRNIFNANVKIGLLGLSLISYTNAMGYLPVANYTASNTSSISGFGVYPLNMATMNTPIIPSSKGKYMLQGKDYAVNWGTASAPKSKQEALKTKNYYPAAAENRKFGGYVLQQIGNGNQEYIAIDGKVSKGYYGDPKDAIKQYGKGVYSYVDSFGDSIYRYEESCKMSGQSGTKNCIATDELRHDLAILQSPLKDQIYIPENERLNINELYDYCVQLNKKGIKLLNKARSMMNNDHPDWSKLKRKATYILELSDRIISRVTAGLDETAFTSNKYIEENIDDIFPSTAKVSSATEDEVSKCGCVQGAFRQYIDPEGGKHALCVGDNVSGKYIADYLSAHPETKDWVSDTFVENAKYYIGKLKNSATGLLQNFFAAM